MKLSTYGHFLPQEKGYFVFSNPVFDSSLHTPMVSVNQQLIKAV